MDFADRDAEANLRAGTFGGAQQDFMQLQARQRAKRRHPVVPEQEFVLDDQPPARVEQIHPVIAEARVEDLVEHAERVVDAERIRGLAEPDAGMSNAGRRSIRTTSTPCRANVAAAVSPPTPPPTTRTRRMSATTGQPARCNRRGGNAHVGVSKLEWMKAGQGRPEDYAVVPDAAIETLSGHVMPVRRCRIAVRRTASLRSPMAASVRSAAELKRNQRRKHHGAAERLHRRDDLAQDGRAEHGREQRLEKHDQRACGTGRCA